MCNSNCGCKRYDPGESAFVAWALKNRINWFRDKQGVIWVDFRDTELLDSYHHTRCFNDHGEKLI
jgi:hypothetical protein